MKSPSKKLLDGELLGDVIESLTGRDVSIRRSTPRRIGLPGSSAAAWSHTTRAFSGQTLVGTAKVIWSGSQADYSALLKSRMREHLREKNAQPVNEHFDPKNGVLVRRFMLKSSMGTLQIHETLFLRQIQLLPRKPISANSHRQNTINRGYI